MKHLRYSLLWLLMIMLLSNCGGDDGIKNPPTKIDINDDDDDHTTATIDDSYTYKLPVIFHVLYQDRNDEKQYVSANRLKEILKNVNDLYAGNIYGTSQRVNVNFIMATTDEQGNRLATPGVDYVEWKGTYPIDAYSFMGDNTGNMVRYIWEPTEYINVMVYNFAATDDSEITTLGISHMPFSTEGSHALAGLETVTYTTLTKRNLRFPYCSSINSLYIDSESDRYTREDHGEHGYTYSSSDVNVTVAHELGHYLGLYHMFSERDGKSVDECLDSDHCEDTPSYNRVAYLQYLTDYLEEHERNGSALSLSDLTKRTPCEGDIFYSANIMDYMVGLGYKLSADQKGRIRHVLYYSPLMPGPRKTDEAESRAKATTPALTPDGPVDLPIRMSVCRQRLLQTTFK